MPNGYARIGKVAGDDLEKQQEYVAAFFVVRSRPCLTESRVAGTADLEGRFQQKSNVYKFDRSVDDITDLTRKAEQVYSLTIGGGNGV